MAYHGLLRDPDTTPYHAYLHFLEHVIEERQVDERMARRELPSYERRAGETEEQMRSRICRDLKAVLPDGIFGRKLPSIESLLRLPPGTRTAVALYAFLRGKQALLARVLATVTAEPKRASGLAPHQNMSLIVWALEYHPEAAHILAPHIDWDAAVEPWGAAPMQYALTTAGRLPLLKRLLNAHAPLQRPARQRAPVPFHPVRPPDAADLLGVDDVDAFLAERLYGREYRVHRDRFRARRAAAIARQQLPPDAQDEAAIVVAAAADRWDTVQFLAALGQNRDDITADEWTAVLCHMIHHRLTSRYTPATPEAMTIIVGEHSYTFAAIPDVRALFRLVVRAGARVDGVKGSQVTPLGLAVEVNDWPMTRMLLEAGASPHGNGLSGARLLHLAVSAACSDRSDETARRIARALVRYGAVPDETVTTAVGRDDDAVSLATFRLMSSLVYNALSWGPQFINDLANSQPWRAEMSMASLPSKRRAQLRAILSLTLPVQAQCILRTPDNTLSVLIDRSTTATTPWAELPFELVCMIINIFVAGSARTCNRMAIAPVTKANKAALDYDSGDEACPVGEVVEVRPPPPSRHAAIYGGARRAERGMYDFRDDEILGGNYHAPDDLYEALFGRPHMGAEIVLPNHRDHPFVPPVVAVPAPVLGDDVLLLDEADYELPARMLEVD